MTLGIVVSLVLGMLFGVLGIFPFPERWVDAALYVLLFGIGMELGRDEEAFREARNLGFRVLFLPLGAMAGSLAGAGVFALCTSFTLGESLAVTSGFGWYSLSGVLLARLGNPSLGLFAFVTNVFREILTLVGVAWVYRVFGGWAAVALGGATSMDTTLGVLFRVSKRLAPLGMMSGVLHSLCVAPCVVFFARFL
ncbi:MAG: lysine exporter LysO family protein [Candidatus Caldatribacterium sp.]|nr:lysine exporter LysO family protein [Candidatus Caldatribacterium sp.]